MNNFKKYRELCGLSQKEVAIFLKVSVQSVSYWETDERKPSYENLIQLANLYHVTTDDLLGRTDGIIQKKPTADTDDGLKKEIIGLIGQLPEDDLPQIRDYAAWLKSRHAK